MSISIRDRADAMLEAAQADSKVTLTDLSRSNAWRGKLSDKGVLQLMDRTDTTAFIVSVDAMADLLASLDERDRELETMSVRDMFAARRARTETKNGDALAAAARESFERRGDRLMEIVAEGGDR